MWLPKKKLEGQEIVEVAPVLSKPAVQLEQASAHTEYEIFSFARAIVSVRTLAEWRTFLPRLRKIFQFSALITGWDESLRTQPVLRDVQTEGVDESLSHSEWAHILKRPLAHWRMDRTTRFYDWSSIVPRIRNEKSPLPNIPNARTLTFTARRGPVGAIAFFAFVDLELDTLTAGSDLEWLLTLTWEAGITAWWHEHKEALVAEKSLLSDRERELLCWVANGKSDPEIAVLAGRSAHTVRNQISRLTKKLGVASRLNAVLLAYEFGWLSTPQLLNTDL